MLATIIISSIILYGLVRSILRIVKQRKTGACGSCGSCTACATHTDVTACNSSSKCLNEK